MGGLRHVSGEMALTLEPASHSPAEFAETQMAGPSPRVSDAVGLEGGLGWGLRTCMSNNADSTGWGTTLGKTLTR